VVDDRRYGQRAAGQGQERSSLPHPPALQNPFWHGDFADPFLLKVRGMYYAFATEPADRPAPGAPIFPILRSEDMIAWEAAGHALAALDAPLFRYWAPEVTAYNGLFYLYYAVHTEEFRAAIRVATAEQPAGPYRDSGRDLTSTLFPWAIDPHVFRDDDGRWYLYYTVEFLELESGLTGTGNVVDVMLDPLTVAGRPARVTAPRHAWQLFEARRAAKGGVDWYTVEGPAVLRHRNRYYELFSGGCYYRDNYAVSYAVSDTPIGAGGLHDASWEDRAGDPANLLIAPDASPASTASTGMAMCPGHRRRPWGRRKRRRVLACRSASPARRSTPPGRRAAAGGACTTGQCSKRRGRPAPPRWPMPGCLVPPGCLK
jgi:GH43 family beta-xylosidase